MATSKVAVGANEPPSPDSDINTHILSFDKDLRHCFTGLTNKIINNNDSIDKLLTILRLRIEGETEFAKSLEKILINYDFCTNNELGTLNDGLSAIKADMKNEYTQRIEFANSLNEDVYQQILKFKNEYSHKNKGYISEAKISIKKLRNSQHNYQKIKNKYDKVCNEANKARQALINAKSDIMYSNQVLKLGNKVNSTLKTQQIWQEKYDEIKLIWNKDQIKFDDIMTRILKNMELNELNRIKTFADILTKWAVFITNLSANRNYDVKSLANQMSTINANNDIQRYIKNMLKLFPNNNINTSGSSSLYSINHTKSLSMSQSLSKRQSMSYSNSDTLSIKINNDISPRKDINFNNEYFNGNNNNNNSNNKKLKNIIKNKIKKMKKNEDNYSNVNLNNNMPYNNKRSTSINVYNVNNPSHRSRVRQHFKTQSVDLKRTNKSKVVDLSQFTNNLPNLNNNQYSESIKYADQDPSINTPKPTNNNNNNDSNSNNNKYRHPNLVNNAPKIKKSSNNNGNNVNNNPTTKKDFEQTIPKTTDIVTKNSITNNSKSSFDRRINRERNKESNTQSIPNDYKIEHKIYRKRSTSKSESTTNNNQQYTTQQQSKFHGNDRTNKFKYQSRNKHQSTTKQQ